MPSTLRIYLDHNATTPLRPFAKDAIRVAVDYIGNPSSTHKDGRFMRKKIDEVRDKIADFFGVESSRIVFHSGATEGLNSILKVQQVPIFYTLLEHSAVLESISPKLGNLIHQHDGVVDLSHLEELLKSYYAQNIAMDDPLVCLMVANNETGIIQPIDDVLSIKKKYPFRLLCDCVQALGKIDEDLKRWIPHIDYAVFSSHKVGGPSGLGFSIFPKSNPQPYITGGGQERFLRSGTQNFLGIIGFGGALDHLKENPMDFLADFQKNIEEALSKKGLTIGEYKKRICNTTCFCFFKKSAETMLMQLDQMGISVSAGSACSSGKIQKSHVLKAMNIPKELINGMIRISLGWNTTAEDIAFFLQKIQNL